MDSELEQLGGRFEIIWATTVPCMLAISNYLIDRKIKLKLKKEREISVCAIKV